MNYDTDNFATDVIERSHASPVLVDFWAEWCGPCKILGPVLEKLAEKHKDRWVMVKVNTEKHPQLAGEYGIRSIPNVKLFVDGEAIDEFVGVLPEGRILQWLDYALPSRHLNQIKDAERLLAEQKVDQARNLLQEVIAEEPDNHQAAVLIARAYLHSDPSQALELVSRIEPGDDYFDLAEAVRTFAHMFRYMDAPDSLKEDAQKDAYLKAISDLHAGDFPAALDGFIEVVQRDRYYDDDGSRKACIAIFKFLGESHEITQQYRPAFSSALYV